MISGIDPIIISNNNFLFRFKLNKSFLKKNIIAKREPKCKLISINNELVFSSYKFDIIIKCADELIGKNSVIPCIADKIMISIRS